MTTAVEASNASRDLLRAERIVDEYEQYDVAKHALFEELNQQPVDYLALWVLMANLQSSISGHFVRWLANVIQRIDDQRIASLLAKQLNDELGNGDFRQMHSVLLERFVSGLAAFCPRVVEQDVFSAGRGLLSALSETFNAKDPYEGVGALMVSEIFAKKMDKCVGDQLRRQSAIPRDTLHWLELHEQLEIDHADDSRELAALVPAQGSHLTAAWRGARAEWAALWGFLDEVHATTAALRGGR